MNIENTAEQTLAGLQKAGFESAQVSISIAEQDELNVAHNEPSLLRSTEDHSLTLVGIIDGRKATASLTDLGETTIARTVDELFARARLAPQDQANAVSVSEQGQFEHGPTTADMDLLATKVEEILAFRAENSPRTTIEEGAASHRLVREVILTSAGTQLSCAIGSYSLGALVSASDGDKSSSINYSGGTAEDLSGKHASELCSSDLLQVNVSLPQ